MQIDPQFPTLFNKLQPEAIRLPQDNAAWLQYTEINRPSNVVESIYGGGAATVV